MASDTPVVADPGRRPDRLGAALAAGFIVLLLATELVLTLPDVADSPSSVANFYVAHRLIIVILQAFGFIAAGLFGAYAWRLRSVDRVVGAAGLVTAVCALVPGPHHRGDRPCRRPREPPVPRLAGTAWSPVAMTSCLSGSCSSPQLSRFDSGEEAPLLGVLAAVVALSCLIR